ncbi:uncharacterized protein A1O9_03821 [Exophiala aquamarina CBS 119918]|uniref:Transmembrane protein 135 N-terminal domain-containing protein n=1 Tax=Exophiala aquamarina CBS 119918 TaxID=1182545 RepID=A0A072PI35_9EURO|nr:uncharacterized protein A1O9_03821 [Exophiala aquamarina CBS 119918]KEF58978.1 hypothetical protein A1O9_03821 [Exophiala aquamarina CBS 119918]
MAVESLPVRYVLNEREYAILRKYLSSASRTKEASTDTSGTPAPYQQNDHNAAAFRSASRVFLLSLGSLKGAEAMLGLLAARKTPTTTRSRAPLVASPTRIALSLSTLLFFHSILYRLFHRLRLQLLHEKVRHIQERYPKIYGVLTSKLAPAIGASLSGVALGICPADQLRVTVAIYIACRALEVGYKAIENTSFVKSNKPSWLGSWMLFAVAQGQLLHAFVFDSDCFPEAYGSFILGYTPEYIQRRPPNISSKVRWPKWNEIVDALAQMARMRWPPFVSPILHPEASNMLPAGINTVISPITSRAHPATQNLSCALIHPSDPSCFLAFLRHILISFPLLARFYALYYGAFSILRIRKVVKAPLAALNRLSTSVLRSTFATTGSIGMAWASICLFQIILPRAFLPKFRFFFGGLLGGFFSLADLTPSGHLTSLYAARTSVDSLWKVGVKRRWWKGIKAGDVWLFVAALALENVVYDFGKDTPASEDQAMTMIKVLRGEIELGLPKEEQQTSEGTSTDDLGGPKFQ